MILQDLFNNFDMFQSNGVRMWGFSVLRVANKRYLNKI